MQLLIPAAKIVNEDLQSIGKLPAIIYPINKGIVFDYLLKQYADTCDSMDIICYEKAEKVHRRLASYNNKKIHIRNLPTLGDLGHTIYYGLSDLHESVIINFADTIVVDNIYDANNDCFFYSEDYFSETWTFFTMKDGMIDTILDKVVSNQADHSRGKLFVGVFQLKDAALFKKCLERTFEERDEEISSFYQALQLYSTINPLTAVETSNWFDIGHADKYYNSKLEVKAREFNHITIDKERGILRKSSDDKEKFIGEIKWYLKLPSDIEYIRPRIFDYSTSYVSPYVSMEYYAYHTVHELFLYGDLNYNQWVEVFNRIRFICEDFKRYTVKDKNIRSALEDMYLIKTLQRFDKIRTDERFKLFFENTVTVNGVKYQSLNQICEKLKEVIPKMLYDVEVFTIIHGDLCFANMMVDSNLSFIKVIDPRGKFGTYDIYGDPRYELAKLFHSVDGKYDFIIKDLFVIEYDSNEISICYQISDGKRDFDLYKVFIEVFKKEIGDELKKIELIESLLFLSMIPLHGENFNHQMAMLGTGLDILNRVIDITEGD